MLLSVACGTIIFAFALERLGTTIEFFKGLLSKLPVEPAFFVTMVKMLGIAYIAEFHPQSVRTVVIAQLHRR